MLTRRESISMFACVEEDRVRQVAFRLNKLHRLVEPRSPAPALLASLLFFFVMRACNRRCLELV